MHLLYFDESGNPFDAGDKHFVLAGISAFEANTWYLQAQTAAIKQKYFPTSPPLDFHCQQIRSGKGFWRNVEKGVRDAVLLEIGQVIATAYESVRLFGAVVEKDASRHGESAIRAALEQVCKRFDTMLRRRCDAGDTQRGLLVLAESSYQGRAKVWVKGFWESGTTWGSLKQICDLPYFAPAAENRLLQLADYVAHALFLLYERHDASLAKGIIGKFDRTDGTLHGLVHMSPSKGAACDCPACTSRRTPGDWGPWVKPQP